jgi:hypothetical protein
MAINVSSFKKHIVISLNQYSCKHWSFEQNKFRNSNSDISSTSICTLRECTLAPRTSYHQASGLGIYFFPIALKRRTYRHEITRNHGEDWYELRPFILLSTHPNLHVSLATQIHHQSNIFNPESLHTYK